VNRLVKRDGWEGTEVGEGLEINTAGFMLEFDENVIAAIKQDARFL
jgi:hypothetical protein